VSKLLARSGLERVIKLAEIPLARTLDLTFLVLVADGDKIVKSGEIFIA